MNTLKRFSSRRECLDHAFYGTFMGHMRQTRGNAGDQQTRRSCK